MIHFTSILQSLLLIVSANSAPVMAKLTFGRHFATPLDGGCLLPDGNPLFGASKTVRGIVCAVLATTLIGMMLGSGWRTGVWFGLLAMTGDLLSSFIKRRLKLPPSSRATGIDQIPEALLPLLGCRAGLGLSLVDVMLCVALFMVGEIYGSRLLYRLHLRDRPY